MLERKISKDRLLVIILEIGEILPEGGIILNLVVILEIEEILLGTPEIGIGTILETEMTLRIIPAVGITVITVVPTLEIEIILTREIILVVDMTLEIPPLKTGIPLEEIPVMATMILLAITARIGIILVPDHSLVLTMREAVVLEGMAHRASPKIVLTLRKG